MGCGTPEAPLGSRAADRPHTPKWIFAIRVLFSSLSANAPPVPPAGSLTDSAYAWVGDHDVSRVVRTERTRPWLLLDKVHNRHDGGRARQLDAEFLHDRSEVRQELIERILAVPDIEDLKLAFFTEA